MPAEVTRSRFPSGFFPALVTGLILAIPLIAMQFSAEVRWDLPDFVIMGALLFGTGLSFELLLRRGGSFVYRAALGLALFSTLFMTWANLAVGLIAAEGSSANLLLLGVPLIGIAGALLAQFRPQGLALTLMAMAIVQAALAALALLEGWKQLRRGSLDVWAPNGLFVVLFLLAATLFLMSSTRRRG